MLFSGSNAAGAGVPRPHSTHLAALVAEEAGQGIAPDALRRLAALLPADVPLAEAVASRFRLSGAQKKRLALAAGRQGDTGVARALAYRLGTEAALDRLLLAGLDITPLRGWEPPQFPLKGGEVVARGVKAGPQVARLLRTVEARWVAEQFPPADRIAELLEQELAKP